MSGTDEIIWQCINHQFCSYKVKTPSQNFCRNEYNVSGLCSRQSCPLANSRYATVRETDGLLCLYIKTVERAHLPAKLWEKIPLSRNYAEALKQIDEALLYWPNFNTHKCKQRLTKLTQYLIKARKLALAPQVKMIAVKPKLTKREAAREQKALIAAKLEKNIEKELVERLRSGVYGEQPLNVNEDVWKRFLDAKNNKELVNEAELEMEEEGLEFIEESDEEASDIEDWWGPEDRELGSQDDDDDDDDDDTDSDSDDSLSSGAKRTAKRKADGSKKGPSSKKARHVEIEYEHETEPQISQPMTV